MRLILVILFMPILLFINSCKSNIDIIKAEKQIIIQGVQKANSFVNYQIEVNIKKDLEVIIDSIKVINAGGYLMVKKYSVHNKKTGSYNKKITKTGVYVIDVPIKNKDIELVKNSNVSDDKVVIYYRGKSRNKMVISQFKQATIRRR